MSDAGEDVQEQPPDTVLCGVCSVEPAHVTWPDATQPPMCNRDYFMYTRAQQTEEAT